jgi:hypothetical protein
MQSPGVSERRLPNTKGSRQTRKQFAQAPPRLLPLGAGVPWWLRADYLKNNPDDAAAIIGEYLNAPADNVKGMLAGDTIYGPADNKRLFGTEDAPGPVYQSMQSVVHFAVESKLIDNAPSVDSLLDPQRIRDAR